MMNAKRLCASLLAMVCIVVCSVGVFAADATVKIDTATTGTKVFDGYKVTVLDKTTPATNIRGRTNDRTVMVFVSAADKEIGSISYTDYSAIVQKNQKLVKMDGGGSYGAPPVEGKTWEDWFADEFNKYRSLGGSSVREKAVKENQVTTIEDYRQEVIRLVNEERKQAGLPALSVDERAMEYAQTRAQEIYDSYSHTRPNGLEKPFDELGGVVENIARGHESPKEVVAGWMDSEGHRGNILNEDAYAIGVGCYGDGPGYFWTQEFLW